MAGRGPLLELLLDLLDHYLHRVLDSEHQLPEVLGCDYYVVKKVRVLFAVDGQNAGPRHVEKMRGIVPRAGVFHTVKVELEVRKHPCGDVKLTMNFPKKREPLSLQLLISRMVSKFYSWN